MSDDTDIINRITSIRIPKIETSKSKLTRPFFLSSSPLNKEKNKYPQNP